MAKNSKLDYTYISVADLVTAKEKDSVIAILKEITNDAWFDFGKSYDEWLSISNYLILVRDADNYIAFDLKGRSGSRDLVFVSSMVRKKYQNSGIINKASRINIKKHFFYLSRLSLVSFLEIIYKPVYFVFRTPNPRLYCSIKKYHPYPSVFSPRECSEKELEIAKRLAITLSPGCRFNENTFVIEKALGNRDLYYSEDNYPKSKNAEVNLYFEKAIDYKNNKGNLQVVVGRISLLSIIR